MRKEPNRRESEQLAGFRCYRNVEVGKDRLAYQRSVQVDKRRHESPGRHLTHHVHVEREEIPPIGQITLHPQLLETKLGWPETRIQRGLISTEIGKKDRDKNLVLIGPVLRDVQLSETITGLQPAGLMIA